MTIWKWTLSLKDLQVFELPMGAKILSVQMQGGIPQLWALVDERQQLKQARRIAIYGTGHQLPESPGEFISTFQMDDGAFVFHVFER